LNKSQIAGKNRTILVHYKVESVKHCFECNLAFISKFSAFQIQTG